MRRGQCHWCPSARERDEQHAEAELDEQVAVHEATSASPSEMTKAAIGARQQGSVSSNMQRWIWTSR